MLTLVFMIPLPKNPRFVNLNGRRFGRLAVLDYAGRIRGNIYWMCRCDCGNERLIFGGNLVRGFSKSCGCMRMEALRQSRITHGCRQTPEYAAWSSMKERCLNPKNPKFHCYGGRGIQICERWLRSFAAFLEDVGPRPSDKHSLERSDTNGDYCPENCSWATQRIQQNNRRNNRRIQFRGMTLTLAEWSRILKIDYHKLEARINRHDWAIDRAFPTP